MKTLIPLILILCLVHKGMRACSCEPDERIYVEAFNDIDVLFTGKLIELGKHKANVTAKFVIDIPHKNTLANDTITIINGFYRACVLPLTEGQSWTIWAFRSGNTWQVSRCGRSRQVNPRNTHLYLKKIQEISTFTGRKSWKFNNNQLGAKGMLKNGVAKGKWKYFHQDGLLKSKGRYKRGQKDGLWEEYSDTLFWYLFKEDFTRRFKEINSHNRIEKIANKNDSLFVYRKKELLSETAEYKYGKLDGEVRFYRFGQLLRKTQYKNGHKHGEDIEWNLDGTISRKVLYENGKFIESLK